MIVNTAVASRLSPCTYEPDTIVINCRHTKLKIIRIFQANHALIQTPLPSPLFSMNKFNLLGGLGTWFQPLPFHPQLPPPDFF
jgi:hypothetical protein